MFIAAVAGSTFTSSLVQPADAGRKGLGTAGSLVEERGGSTTNPPPLYGFRIHVAKEQVPSGLCPWEADGVGLAQSAEVGVVLTPCEWWTC